MKMIGKLLKNTIKPEKGNLNKSIRNSRASVEEIYHKALSDHFITPMLLTIYVGL